MSIQYMVPPGITDVQLVSWRWYCQSFSILSP